MAGLLPGEEKAAVTMALAVISSDDTHDIIAELDQLQFEQFEHDETYHREITRLPLHQRLRHMTLHFAKYSGNLVEAQARGDHAQIQRVVTDVFIIGMSTANALNFTLGAAVAEREADRAGREFPFAATLAVYAGKMAAACEKLDHLEDFPYRPVLREGTLILVRAALLFAEAEGWDLRQLVRIRLKPVKEKFIHHGRS
jgi:hypothetical protein